MAIMGMLKPQIPNGELAIWSLNQCGSFFSIEVVNSHCLHAFSFTTFQTEAIPAAKKKTVRHLNSQRGNERCWSGALDCSTQSSLWAWLNQLNREGVSGHLTPIS